MGTGAGTADARLTTFQEVCRHYGHKRYLFAKGFDMTDLMRLLEIVAQGQIGVDDAARVIDEENVRLTAFDSKVHRPLYGSDEIAAVIPSPILWILYSRNNFVGPRLNVIRLQFAYQQSTVEGTKLSQIVVVEVESVWLAIRFGVGQKTFDNQPHGGIVATDRPHFRQHPVVFDSGRFSIRP